VVGWFVDAGSLASLAPHRVGKAAVFGNRRGLWIKSSRSLGLVGYSQAKANNGA
jgi:hypothetical protein